MDGNRSDSSDLDSSDESEEERVEPTQPENEEEPLGSDDDLKDDNDDKTVFDTGNKMGSHV